MLECLRDHVRSLNHHQQIQEESQMIAKNLLRIQWKPDISHSSSCISIALSLSPSCFCFIFSLNLQISVYTLFLTSISGKLVGIWWTNLNFRLKVAKDAVQFTRSSARKIRYTEVLRNISKEHFRLRVSQRKMVSEAFIFEVWLVMLGYLMTEVEGFQHGKKSLRKGRCTSTEHYQKGMPLCFPLW